ncbi:MAG: hypothetical protein H7Z42_15290, partial [Roseiflexaceae bacterium]|nr:hypothetical protein [Roseiflexaceae bacterium]
MTDSEAQSWITTVGPALLVLIAALGRLGIPTMLSIFLIAAGGLAHSGIIPAAPVFAFSLAGLTIGDCAAYTLGRRSVARLAELHKKRELVRRARALLARYHVLAVFFSRF